MIKLKNHRPVRLIDSQGRFDLKPGETVSFSTIPKDLKGLVKNGFLLEVKPKQKASSPETNQVEIKDVKTNEMVEEKETAPTENQSSKSDDKPVKRNKGK